MDIGTVRFGLGEVDLAAGEDHDDPSSRKVFRSDGFVERAEYRDLIDAPFVRGRFVMPVGRVTNAVARMPREDADADRDEDDGDDEAADRDAGEGADADQYQDDADDGSSHGITVLVRFGPPGRRWAKASPRGANLNGRDRRR